MDTQDLSGGAAVIDAPGPAATIDSGSFDPLVYMPPREVRETGIAVRDGRDDQPPALRDFRQQFMMAPVEVMRAGLVEYEERRKTFRDWLKGQLVEGLHYGYPPGCEPKYCDQRGRSCDESTAYGTLDKKNNVVSLATWAPKPSFYKAGADFLCDLLWARDEYDADLAAWEQLGKPNGTFVFRCRLYSRSSGELLGEGRGCRRVSTNRMAEQENGAIKMAKKSAKVDAVLNAWALADLFTQDTEDDPPPPNPSSPVDPNAPVAQSRDDRVTKEAVDQLGRAWQKTAHPDDRRSLTSWSAFVMGATNRDWGLDSEGRSNVARWLAWTPKDVELVTVAIAERGEWQE